MAGEVDVLTIANGNLKIVALDGTTESARVRNGGFGVERGRSALELATRNANFTSA